MTDADGGAPRPSAETADDDASAQHGAEQAGGEQPSGDQPGGEGAGSERLDLRSVLKQFTAPMLESLDSRLREQVEVHTDELLTTKVDAAVADRLATVDRAIADLSRRLEALERTVEAMERGEEPLDAE